MDEVQHVRVATSDAEAVALAAVRPRKIYERVGSLNKFYCGGRGLSGPDRVAFVGAVLMTLVPNVCFFLFEGPWMWSYFSPAIPIIQAVVLVAVFVLHMVTAFSDPGILPRLLEDDTSATDSDPWRRGRPMAPQTQNVEINGVSVQTKWCRTCQIHRPPRAIHCGTCDNCVDCFDHHCPWTGNCVGRRNYRTFLYFVTLVPLFSVWTIGVLVAKMAVLAVNSPMSGWDAFWQAVTVDPAAPIIAIYCLFPLGLVGFLGVYHVMLSAAGETTNERIKGTYRNGNPHSRGCWRNCFSRWCGYSVPRFVKFHQTHMEDLSSPELPGQWLPLPRHGTEWNELEMVSVEIR